MRVIRQLSPGASSSQHAVFRSHQVTCEKHGFNLTADCDCCHGTKVQAVLLFDSRDSTVPRQADKSVPRRCPVHSSTLVGPALQHHAVGPITSIPMEGKPPLISFDSGQECSLEHFLEVRRLVEREDRELKGYVFDDECLHVSG